MGGEVKVDYYGEDRFGTQIGSKLVAPIYSFNALEWLTRRIKHAVKRKWDQVTLITGLERDGKTTLGFDLADALDPNFLVEHVAFTTQEAISMIDTLDKGDVAILDEAGVAAFAQEWMMQEQRDLVKVFQTFGMRQLQFILILPHRMLLNKQLRNRRLHYWFHVFSVGFERGWARLRQANPNEWQVETWFDPVFTMKFPKYEGPKWDEYEKRKWEFIHKGVKSSLGRKEAKHRMRLHKAIWQMATEKKVEIDEIAKTFGYDKKTISNILYEIRRNPNLINVSI